MAENDVRPTTGTAQLPRPRAASKDIGLWAEPLHFAPRPRTQYWDADIAGWRSGAAVPSPRSGD
jgi:hypothetical protein